MSIRKLVHLLAWRNWGVIRYNSIFQNAMALFYLALVYRQFSWAFLGKMGVFGLLSLIGTAYGYLVNDLADRELDREHGKSNVFARVRPAVAMMVVGLTSGLCVAVSSFFWTRPGFLPTFVAWLSLATFYSLPPLRLKVRGEIGLAATILAQQTVPGLLLVAVFGRLWSWEALAFALYITCRGTTSDVSHQMRDWANDVRTGTQTVAVRRGYKWMTTLYAWALEAEKLMLGVAMVFLVMRIPTVTLPLLGCPFPPVLPLLLFYLLLYVLTAGRAWGQIHQGALIDPHDPERQATTRDAYQIIHHSLPSVGVPLYLCLWMTVYYWPNAIFLIALGFLFKLWSPNFWIGVVRGWLDS